MGEAGCSPGSSEAQAGNPTSQHQHPGGTNGQQIQPRAVLNSGEVMEVNASQLELGFPKTHGLLEMPGTPLPRS